MLTKELRGKVAEGPACRLSDEQEAQLPALLNQGAEAHGFRGASASWGELVIVNWKLVPLFPHKGAGKALILFWSVKYLWKKHHHTPLL